MILFGVAIGLIAYRAFHFLLERALTHEKIIFETLSSDEHEASIALPKE
jgi:hypothetical protein